jgi:A/G-specific adenine glycosylase
MGPTIVRMAPALLLLRWFGANARDLPWRRTKDPYAIWVSEIMLQQTQVKTVVPFFERWMKALPTISSLARARPAKLHKLWEGLGYYTRVRNLQKAARLIVNQHGGRFPTRFEDVLELPGIGRYTAGAICSIAFNQPKPVLDGNVTRVLSRVFGVYGDPRQSAVNGKLWELADSLVRQADALARGENSKAESKISTKGPSGYCSHLNQALMELGALICTPREPRCGACPVSKDCIARKRNRVEQLPELARRPRPIRRRFVGFVTRRGQDVLVRQRPAGVVNGHLWEFPNVEVSNKDGDARQAASKLFGAVPAKPRPLCTIRHSITRYRMRLDAYEIWVNRRSPAEPNIGRWVPLEQLSKLAFASAHKKILSLIGGL